MHMTFRLLFFIGLACWMGHSSLQAQDTLRVLNAFVLLEIDTTQQHAVPNVSNPNAMDSIAFCVKVLALFSDTTDLDRVYIKVGRTPGAQDVANVSFAYNGGNIVPLLPEFEPNPQGFSVCVSPSAKAASTLYLEVWADDKLGNTTPVYTTQVN